MLIERRRFLSAALASAGAACAAALRQSDGDVSLRRLGASTACLAGMPLLDAMAEIARLGFGTIEMIAYAGARHSVGEIPGFDYARSSARERERVFEATRRFRHISAHLPFQDLSLFSSDRAAREAGLERLRHAIDGLAYLKGELGVMHIGWPEKGKRYRDIWMPMVETLRMLGDYAAARGIRIGIETMQPDSVREYVDLVHAAEHPAIGATIDTGHIRGSADIGLPAGRRATEEGRTRFNDVLNTLVATLAGRIFHFHLSDVRPSDWADHRTIGSGIVDFDRLFTTVRKVGYGKLFVFELEEPDRIGALESSRDHVRRINPTFS